MENNISSHFLQNLLIWLSFDLTNDPYLNPIFRNMGYKLDRIEVPYSIPAFKVAKVKGNNLLINNRVNIDILMKNELEKSFIIFECKKSGFSETSSDCSQARGYLSITNNEFSLSIGKSQTDIWNTKPTYIVKSSDSCNMYKTLQTLHDELSKLIETTKKFYCMGVSIEIDGLYITSEKSNDILNGSEKIKVINDGNYMPLMLFPFNPDCDITAREKLSIEEIIRTRIYGSLIRYTRSDRRIPISELYSNIIPIWDYWDAKSDGRKAFKRQVKRYTKKVLDDVNKKIKTNCQMQDDYIIYEKINNDQRMSLIKLMKRRNDEKNSELMIEQFEIDIENLRYKFADELNA